VHYAIFGRNLVPMGEYIFKLFAIFQNCVNQSINQSNLIGEKPPIRHQRANLEITPRRKSRQQRLRVIQTFQETVLAKLGTRSDEALNASALKFLCQHYMLYCFMALVFGRK
jgi:hypothetical protein